MVEKSAPATRASTRNKLTMATTSRTTAATPMPAPAKATRARTAAPAAGASRAPAAKKTTAPKGKPKTNAKTTTPDDTEPIKAYLRIRPNLGEEGSSQPYLRCTSQSVVEMLQPANNRSYRASSVSPPAAYSFTHVFEDVSQADFFKETTLPLVRDVLQGQNALLFAYGATNAGKTYTMQGGSTPATAGILPRCIDVLFNSTNGLRGSAKFKPARLHGIEIASAQDAASVALHEPLLADIIGEIESVSYDNEVDSTCIPVDRNYDHSIWISYAEVYNEKVYDLLDTFKDNSGVRSNIPRPQTTSVTRQALSLKTSPISDDEQQAATGGKYIQGLRQFQVKTAAEAKKLIHLGQQRRRVYGTLANQSSSRSHGMVFIKILRGHRGEKNDQTTLQVSRFTLVDLAGSERTKHTHTTGERLKEAGNINNSLMVLGQCLETIRTNQKKLAASLAPSDASRMDTRDVKKGLAIVPFTHSKLTQILQDYFVGDGRTAMIVNVNPSDTGYDENSHVMKFAALAREVRMAPVPAPIQRAPPVPEVGPGVPRGKYITELGPLKLRDPDIIPRRKVTLSTGGGTTGLIEQDAVIEITELDETLDSNEDPDDYPTNPLVDSLFEEIDRLRTRLFETELYWAEREALVRTEVAEEYEKLLQRYEQRHEDRLAEEIENQNRRTDEKIDLLYNAGIFNSPTKPRATRGATGGSPKRGTSDTDDDSLESPPPSPTRPKASRFTTLADGMAALSLRSSPFDR